MKSVENKCNSTPYHLQIRIPTTKNCSSYFNKHSKKCTRH